MLLYLAKLVEEDFIRKYKIMCKEKIAIYHRVYRRENFEKAAKDLFGLIRMAQKRKPNVERILYVDIDGHRNAVGGYDADMQELQIEFRRKIFSVEFL